MHTYRKRGWCYTAVAMIVTACAEPYEPLPTLSTLVFSCFWSCSAAGLEKFCWSNVALLQSHISCPSSHFRLHLYYCLCKVPPVLYHHHEQSKQCGRGRRPVAADTLSQKKHDIEILPLAKAGRVTWKARERTAALTAGVEDVLGAASVLRQATAPPRSTERDCILIRTL